MWTGLLNISPWIESQSLFGGTVMKISIADFQEKNVSELFCFEPGCCFTQTPFCPTSQRCRLDTVFAITLALSTCSLPSPSCSRCCDETKGRFLLSFLWTMLIFKGGLIWNKWLLWTLQLLDWKRKLRASVVWNLNWRLPDYLWKWL